MINQYVLKKTYVLWIIIFSLMKNPFYCQIDIHQSPKFVHDIVTGIIFSSYLLSQKVVVHITEILILPEGRFFRLTYSLTGNGPICHYMYM